MFLIDIIEDKLNLGCALTFFIRAKDVRLVFRILNLITKDELRISYITSLHNIKQIYDLYDRLFYDDKSFKINKMYSRKAYNALIGFMMKNPQFLSKENKNGK